MQHAIEEEDEEDEAGASRKRSPSVVNAIGK
jgi:hypothetical protein